MNEQQLTDFLEELSKKVYDKLSSDSFLNGKLAANDVRQLLLTHGRKIAKSNGLVGPEATKNIFVLLRNEKFMALYSTEEAALSRVKECEAQGATDFSVEENFYHSEDECWKVFPEVFPK